MQVLPCLGALWMMAVVTVRGAPPPPPTPCQAALKSVCGAALAGCEKYPCTACLMCVIGNQTVLGQKGCTSAEQQAYCSAPAPIPPPPPLSCTHTDSRGDSYDLSSVDKVDQLAKTVDNRPAYYHIGICSSPTQDPTDPTKGCLPPCQNEPGSDCSGWRGGFDDECKCKNDRSIDVGGEAVCQYDSLKADPDKPVIQYNCGMLKPGEQKWGDGPEPGQGVTLTYEGGSMRGGCEPHNRSTTIVVECDPCKLKNITKVEEPQKCQYKLTVSSVAGCPTNKPLPAGSCPHLCDLSTMTCKAVAAGTPGANSSLGECTKTCTKAPPPPPPPPLSKNPCIRFGHTIPVEHHVDVVIAQDPPGPSITHTWTNFKFGDFSDWVNLFKPGTGTITVYENTGGTRGAQIYQLKGIPLTPGPLVVVIKVAASVTANASAYWPPALPDSVETIAASYVDTDPTSKVRLFNLAPDVKAAGMSCSANGTTEIATNIAYSLGSDWQPVPTQSATYSFMDDIAKKTLTTKSLTPAAPPIGNTNVLLGLAKGTGEFVIQAVSLVDAPEGGTCHP